MNVKRQRGNQESKNAFNNDSIKTRNKLEINTRQLNKSDFYIEFNKLEININLYQQIETTRDLSKVAKFNKLDFNQLDFTI
jgi:hypothetical protein